MMDLVGLWECGHCYQITDESHFYMDRMTGLMQHDADRERRQKKADRCGWSYDYFGMGVLRCALRHGHSGWDGHKGRHWPDVHGAGPFGEDAFAPSARPPYDPATANVSGPSSSDDEATA